MLISLNFQLVELKIENAKETCAIEVDLSTYRFLLQRFYIIYVAIRFKTCIEDSIQV